MFGIRKPFLFSAAIMAAVGLTAAGGAFAHGAQTARAENTDLTANQTVYTEGDNRFTFTCEEGQDWTLTAYEGTAKHLVLPSPERISVSSGQPAVESYAIGENVFTAAAAMRTVQLPEGVTAVGAGAFADTKLTELSLPETVTAIGAQAFRGCWVLGSVVFEEGENELTLGDNCFNDCISLTNIELPARCTSVASGAFGGCEALEWAYVQSSALDGATDVFSGAEGLRVVFSQQKDCERAVQSGAVAAQAATHTVDVTFHVEGQAPFTVQRLFGEEYSFERVNDENSKDYNGWHTNIELTDLPAQHDSYISTVWYRDAELTKKASLEYVNGLLKGEEKISEIALYAHATLTPPSVLKSATHAFESEGFALSDAEKMASLVGLESYKEKSALVYSAVADDGSSALTHIAHAGTYLVSVSLDGDYGVWKNVPVTTLTVTGGTARTTQIMLIMLSVLGLLAVVLTIALVLVRSRTGRKKRKELTSEEAIDKFIASGGRTRLKK